MESTLQPSTFEMNIALTIVGLKGDQDSQQFMLDEIGRKHPLINHISMPYGCQVVWSIDKQKDLYDTFIGCVVSELESVPKEFTTHQIPNKNYAVFAYSGTRTNYMEFIKSVYYDWFPNSGYEYNDDDFSYFHFHKTSPEKVDMTLPEHERIYSWEIWFPLR